MAGQSFKSYPDPIQRELGKHTTLANQLVGKDVQKQHTRATVQSHGRLRAVRATEDEGIFSEIHCRLLDPSTKGYETRPEFRRHLQELL